MAKNYDRAAWFYESSAQLFSLGQIKAAKKYQLEHINAGQRILYLGVGAGEDALLSARQGAQVTCVDISQGMLDRCERKLKQEGLSAEFICQSALDHDRTEHYDIVATNFFLNVFRRDNMVAMLNHAATLVKPDGKFLIADVATPQGNPISKAFNLLYLKTAMASFCLMGMVPWHENYDYPAFFPDAGLTLQHVEPFRFGGVGPVVYQSIVATKN